jgi:NitT/TauT family transport system ATP-binding protein
VTKQYRSGVLALERVNLTVERGDFVTIVGPSGCGKSTLLRLVAGLISPTEGTITTPEIEHHTDSLGFVFQDAHLLPWRTAQRNAELLLEVTGTPRAERKRRAKETLELVGLKGFEAAYPRELSGGMKMRVSLARALVLQPQLFLLDEPFGAVDEITRHRLNDDLLALQRSAGFTALFVTHSVGEAVFLSTRVAVMSARPGRIVEQISIPLERKRVPRLRTSAEFAGLCGLVSAVLEKGI